MADRHLPEAQRLRRVCPATLIFGKFSDASREDRLKADLPEVNLPPWFRLRGGAGESMNK